MEKFSGNIVTTCKVNSVTGFTIYSFNVCNKYFLQEQARGGGIHKSMFIAKYFVV